MISSRWLVGTLVVSLLAGCGSPSGTDGGVVPDSGVAGDGGVPEARPARAIYSDDGMAVLWVPDGGVAASANIQVHARHDGGFLQYELTPAGLTFNRPAFLLAATPFAARDGGIASMQASLVSEDGGTEKPRAIRFVNSGQNSLWSSYTVVPVRHFSTIQLGIEPPGDLKLYMEITGRTTQDIFVRAQHAVWTEELEIKHVVTVPFTNAFPGNWWVTASGAVSLEGPAGAAPAPIPGDTAANGKFSFSLKCTGIGLGTYTVLFDSPVAEQQLAFTVYGVCNPAPLGAALSQTAPPTPRTPPQTAAAVTEQIQTALTAPSATSPAPSTGVAPVQGYEAIEAMGFLINVAEEPANVETSATLECTRCELNVAKVATVTLHVGAGASILATVGQLHVTTSNGVVEPLNGPNPTVGVGKLIVPSSDGILDGPGIGIASMQYRCLKPGTDSVRIVAAYAKIPPPVLRLPFFDLAQFAQSKAVQFSPGVETMEIVCDGSLKGDAIMLADNTRVNRSGASWTLAAATGVTANLIHAHADVEARFFPVSAEAIAYGGIGTFRSNAGLTPLTLTSGRQTGTATFNGTRYALTGLVAGAAFNASDQLTVQHTPSAGPPVTVTVAAPPQVADINAMLGTPAGWDTEVRPLDGTFDTLFVFVLLAPPAGKTGEFGVQRFVQASAMPLSGGRRTGKLLDADTQARVTELGYTVQWVYVALYNTQSTTAFFPSLRALPVQAGRMFQIAPADLGL